jgi:tRNA wybutosine-synthesizing protein 4
MRKPPKPAVHNTEFGVNWPGHSSTLAKSQRGAEQNENVGRCEMLFLYLAEIKIFDSSQCTNMDQSDGYQDEAASIETNSYSIISKRSVEKLYYPNDPSFLKPFVPKFKRRAPLINRGYWLRSKAVESAVETFLASPDDRTKVVMNLGCGYDPLPFRMKYKNVPGHVKFIDVDYSDLIRRKITAIRQDHKLKQYVEEDLCKSSVYGGSPITDYGWYCLVGCDLGDIDTLSRIFEDVIDIVESDILFVAEVSITYMPLLKSDRLIQWAASHEHGEMIELCKSTTTDHVIASFFLLEQILPAGPTHPFAKTMLDHFAKQTPLQSVLDYPTLSHQRNRFRKNGFNNIYARTLWDFWEDEVSVSVVEKRQLDRVEPFDEWEEFILFTSHYVILHASQAEPFSYDRQPQLESTNNQVTRADVELPLSIAQISQIPSQNYGLRMTNALALQEANASWFATQAPTRKTLPFWNIYGSSKPKTWPAPSPVPENISHTITTIDHDRSLLVGGRVSPLKVSNSCFLYRQSTNNWTKVHDLPEARYRHCAIAVSLNTNLKRHAVLVFGGRTAAGTVLSDWWLWTEMEGWKLLPCHISGSEISPSLFGATMTDTFLLGGLTDDLKFNQKSWIWNLEQDCKSELLRIKLTEMTHDAPPRFGAFGSVLPKDMIVIIGGVAPIPLLAEQETMILSPTGWSFVSLFNHISPRPFLLAAIITLDKITGNILITGGGGVCFSFGSCFNANWYLLSSTGRYNDKWDCYSEDTSKDVQKSLSTKPFKISSINIPSFTKKVRKRNYEFFGAKPLESVISDPLEPVLLISAPLGACLKTWTIAHLETALTEKIISIHTASTRYLRFYPTKNFEYQTCPFSEFADLLRHGKHVYLRALAAQETFKQPADLWRDFPHSLVSDFVIPNEIKYLLQGKTHSSVLRVSGNVAVWAHYDVMSNFYFQIQGEKRFLLFPPGEVLNLRFAPGATSSPADIEEGFKGINYKEVTLHPGDILFIPRFWAHVTYSIPISGQKETFSVAVNIFWRDLNEASYAAGRDVYGSRDLGAYEWGREVIQRLAGHLKSESTTFKAEVLARYLNEGKEADQLGVQEVKQVRERFEKLPEDVQSFYLPRLADELLSLC